MSIRTPLSIALLALAAASAPALAQGSDLLGSMKDKLGAAAAGAGLSMPAIGSGTLGNAAGVIQYCIKNNYLNAASAGGVKDKLLSMVTGQKPQQAGYTSGTRGLLTGSDGQSLNMQGLSAQLKEKACDYVLKNASSLV